MVAGGRVSSDREQGVAHSDPGGAGSCGSRAPALTWLVFLIFFRFKQPALSVTFLDRHNTHIYSLQSENTQQTKTTVPPKSNR